jgi:hypothetical protein
VTSPISIFINITTEDKFLVRDLWPPQSKIWAPTIAKVFLSPPSVRLSTEWFVATQTILWFIDGFTWIASLSSFRYCGNVLMRDRSLISIRGQCESDGKPVVASKTFRQTGTRLSSRITSLIQHNVSLPVLSAHRCMECLYIIIWNVARDSTEMAVTK